VEFPPRVKVGGALDVGCEEAGCAADVPPRLNAEGFAGVEEGVVLPRPPKRPPAGLGVSCAAGVAWFPPRVKPPEGFAAACPEVAPPNRLGAEEVVVAGFVLPNKEGALPVAWLFCWPNKDEPD